MSRRAVGDHAALGVLHSGGSSAAGTHQSRELITSTPRRRPAAGGARSWNHGPQGRVVEAGAPLGGASLPGNHPGAASPEGCAPLRHNHVWGHTARGTQGPGDSALRGAAPGCYACLPFVQGESVKHLFLKLFVFGCAGSSLLHKGFL